MFATMSLQRVAWLILFTAFAALLCHSWYGPDIWYHLTWGRDLWTSSSWAPIQHTLIRQPAEANPYWLFQLVMHTSYERGGIVLGSAVLAMAWVGVLTLWLSLSQALNKPLIGQFILLCLILTLQLRFEHRPEVFSYLFLLLTMRWFLKADPNDESGREFAHLFIIQMLWTNTHSYFALGPILASAYLVASLIGKSGDLRRAVVALVVSGLASLATPFGWRNWTSIWSYMQIGQKLRDFNAELFPPAFSLQYWPYALYWFLFLVIAVLLLRSVWLKRLDFAWFAAFGGLLLSSQAARNIPLLMVMGAPLLADLPRLEAREIYARLSATIAAALALILLQATVTSRLHRSIGSLGSFGVRLEPSAYPVAATEFLKKQGFHGRLFTDSYDGGYVEYHIPEVQVAGDSYFSDPNLTLAFFNATRDPEFLAQLHQKLRFDAFLINVENLEILDALLNDPNLVLVHADSHRALFYLKGQSSAYENQSVAAKSTYYRDEDLRNWNNAIGVITWSAVFRKYRWRQPMLKVLQDIEAARNVPSAVLRNSMRFAEETKDHEMAQLNLALVSRLHETEPGQKEEILQLERNLRACCF